jgi:hypothetical protein
LQSTGSATVGDAKIGSRSTRAGTKRSIRRRAVGTRDKIISHLATVDEINDPAGMASTRLAEAVGYPGSSVAFAQLLSGMERDGLIIREIRGKRTYRITLPADVPAGAGTKADAGRGGRGSGRAGVPGAGGPDLGTGLGGALGNGLGSRLGNGAMAAAGQSGGLSAAAFGGVLAAPTGVDYDELARRLLVQVVRRLAATSLPHATARLATVDVPGAVAESRPADKTDGAEADGTEADGAQAEGAGTGDLRPGPDLADAKVPDADTEGGDSRETEHAALQQTVVGLERELATAWSRQGSLTAENARLREQLREAQRDLARERTRRAQITNELNQAEVVLLERLLSPAPEDEEKHPDAATK